MTMVACCCFSGMTWVYLVGVGVKGIYVCCVMREFSIQNLYRTHILRSLLPKFYCRGISNCTCMCIGACFCLCMSMQSTCQYIFSTAFAFIIITHAWFVAIFLSSQLSFQADRRADVNTHVSAQPWSFGTPTLGFTYVQSLPLNNRLGVDSLGCCLCQAFTFRIFVQDSEVTSPTNL